MTHDRAKHSGNSQIPERRRSKTCACHADETNVGVSRGQHHPGGRSSLQEPVLEHIHSVVVQIGVLFSRKLANVHAGVDAPAVQKLVSHLRDDEQFLAVGDLTGNVRLSLPKAGLFLETTGARENPAPTVRDRKSLKGAKAGRLIRALADYRPPVGLRELAKRAGVDSGYTSRVIDVLNREALVVRTARGPITGTDWPALLRRWSQEYSPFQRKGVTWYLAPRGLGPVADKLKTASSRYAVSGSWAATQFASVAPARLLLCYADDPEAMARELELRPTDAGASVALVTPYDPIVYERTSQKKGITVAALSQIAVDLLTSPGRGPNEGEALIEWMRENEHVWRA
jgi:hypothetical protein